MFQSSCSEQDQTAIVAGQCFWETQSNFFNLETLEWQKKVLLNQGYVSNKIEMRVSVNRTINIGSWERMEERKPDKRVLG